MAGYNGWSMSNNAVQAYEDGEKPLSKWTKKTLVYELADALDAEPEEVAEVLKPYTVKEVKDKCLTYSSWHHTSSRYNRTAFYELDDFEDLADLECRLSGKPNTAKEERENAEMEALQKAWAEVQAKYYGKMPTDKEAVKKVWRYAHGGAFDKEVEKSTAYMWLTANYDLYNVNRNELEAIRNLLSRSAEIDALNWVPFDADLFNRIASEDWSGKIK